MKDELIEQIVGIIKDSKQFVLDQAPDIAKQIVLWARIVEPIETILFGCLFLAGIYLIRLCHRKVSAREWDEVTWAPVGIGAVILILVGFIVAICELECAIKAYVAPKLYLLSYLAELAKHQK